ncbi:MAG: amidohydrolase [Spirochaeta sp.]|nr:amidohydrolase [Spirochaeta sp.]RPG07224.1 MAG: D-aminoacylase [Proteobacteria bacterium TMED72]
MFDILIKHGTIVDGKGGTPFEADVAIEGDRIVAVGDLGDAKSRDTIDAKGLLVTPGFVDVHTHYDGQATWDALLTPSCWHGVTTVVMGNCGVGFAPVRPDHKEWLIELMEGVEDIPGTALADGIQWDWESFPEYLDALEKFPRAVDVGTQVPHGAVRGFVMGKRGANNEAANPEEIQEMANLVEEAITAGALGFSTSRTLVHRALDGQPVPGTFAAEDELMAIGDALERAGSGVFELAPAGVMGEDLAAPKKEVDWMRRLSARTGRPVSFALVQIDQEPELWREILDLCEEAVSEGAQLIPQVGSRPTMLLIGLQTFSPFSFKPTFSAMEEWSLEERVAELRKPEVKEQILAEESVDPDPLLDFVFQGMDKIFVLGESPDYEPGPEKSIEFLAKESGESAESVLYDRMLDFGGRALLMVALVGYKHGNLEAMREMLSSSSSVFGLGDGGAHCGAICDASMTTFMLTHWARDRIRGDKMPLEWVIRKMTRETAELYGLNDRGCIEAGFKADLNLIDHESLKLELPHIAHDLPGGARRLIQKAQGYETTIVSGEVTFQRGEETGARPGRVIRGPQEKS